MNDGTRVTITPCPGGPLLVRGAVDLGIAGHRRRRTIALCRCEASTISPFCDGSHKLVVVRPDEHA